jgi:predicted amidohydrolase
MQPFTLGGERDYYEPGAAPTIFRWHDCSVAPFICYDLRFPEIFRPVAAQGAELLTVIANWPAARDHHWQALLRARAIENVAYVMGINRAGRDPHTSYSGHSLIVGPDGNTLAAAGEGEEIITATIDRELLANFRRKLPFLADLRTDYVRSI